MMTEKEWREKFSKTIIMLMRRKGMDQRELANRAGISESTLSRYLTKRRTANGYIIDKLMEVLK